MIGQVVKETHADHKKDKPTHENDAPIKEVDKKTD
jgi:hypothetical protein